MSRGPQRPGLLGCLALGALGQAGCATWTVHDFALAGTTSACTELVRVEVQRVAAESRLYQVTVVDWRAGHQRARTWLWLPGHLDVFSARMSRLAPWRAQGGEPGWRCDRPAPGAMTPEPLREAGPGLILTGDRLELWQEGALLSWAGLDLTAEVPTHPLRRAALLGLPLTVAFDIATAPVQLVIGIVFLVNYDGPWP